MLFELRRYHLAPGSLPRMYRRMERQLLPMFATTGVPRPSAIWGGSAIDGQPVLSWILAWESFDVRKETWSRAAPIWQRIKAEAGEPEFVTRTDLTLIEPWEQTPLGFADGPGGCEALWHVQPRVGAGGAFRAACLNAAFAPILALGANAVVACDLLFGPLPRSLLFTSWPSRAVRDAALSKLERDTVDGFGLDGLIEASRWEALDRAGLG